jgi:hypothetical protein
VLRARDWGNTDEHRSWPCQQAAVVPLDPRHRSKALIAMAALRHDPPVRIRRREPVIGPGRRYESLNIKRRWRSNHRDSTQSAQRARIRVGATCGRGGFVSISRSG